MRPPIDIHIERQPDDLTCGPTCLHALYRFFGDDIDLTEIIDQVDMLAEGGTLAANLGAHALLRGYAAKIVSFNISVFDPSWFDLNSSDLTAKLLLQAASQKKHKTKVASLAYANFLSRGGKISFCNLTSDLIADLLRPGIPVLVGLSSTFLYKTKREIPSTGAPDDIAGEPSGHFVVLTGYDTQRKTVTIEDPYYPNPLSKEKTAQLKIEHLLCAILLGVITYDANLLIITKESKQTQ